MTQRLFLRVVSGSRQGTSIALKEEEPLAIGRVRAALRLDDPLVSGTHCRIVFRNGHFVLQDLGSTNGTFVDGRPVQDVVLRPGSELVVGNTRIVLFDSEDADGDSDTDGVAWLLDDEAALVAPNTPPLSTTPKTVRGYAPRLRVVAGVDRHREFVLADGHSVIGRNNGEVALADAEVSRKHAIVEVFGRSMVFVRDLGSTNGSYHNGRRIHVAQVRSGDTVGCGKSVMRFLS